MRDQTLVLLCALAFANAGTVRFRTEPHHVVYADPKLAPTICAASDSDGILVAHEHCNQFYQCWDGIPIARHCYGDLQYNPSTGICDWPHSVECGARIIPEYHEEQNNADKAPEICASEGSEELLIAHSHCDKFYKCSEGRAISYKCPGLLLYNAAVGFCDCASNVACGDRTITEPEEENDSSDNGNDNPSEAPSICAADDSDGVLVAHEYCNMFYKCNHGEIVEFECFGGLLFNPSKGHCDWSENVNCGDRTIPEFIPEENSSENGGTENGGGDNEGSDSGSTENGGSDNGGSGTCNCNPGEAPSICAQDGSEGTLIAHENCCQYYQCVHGVPIAQTCPSGLFYNPYKEQCDWPYNVECGNRLVPEENSSENGGTENGGGDDGGSDSGSTENGGSDNEGSGTCNCNPGEAPSICSQDGSDGTLIAHENCGQYFQCVHGVPIGQTCPSGLLYNPYNEQCDWAHNVECGDRMIPEENSSENGGGDNGGLDSGSTENGGSDNGGSGTCNCSPGEAPSICSQDGSDGTLIAHENCGQYYQCVHGVPIGQTCPSGLLYNPYNEQCDWAHNVECGDRMIPEENSSENGGGDNGGLDSGSTENGGSDNGGSGTCNCSPGDAPSICSQDGSDGTLIAHENCGQYYQCVHGVPIGQTCPSGLLYNPYNEQCDWAHNIECGDRVIPEENSSENGVGDNGGSESGSTENGGSDNGGSGTCNCNPGEAPSICAQDGSEGTLIAHENCCQYYQCVHGVPIAQTCPSGLFYNPYKEQCDWPYNVECGNRLVPEENSSENGGTENGGGDDGGSDSGSTENGGSDNEGSGTCNCNPGEAPSICSQDGSDGTLIAHENCGQYYQCVYGVPITQTCPSGLLYNPYKEQCDWAYNVECGNRLVPEENSSENGGGDNGGSDSGSTENGGSDNGGSGTCNCSPGEAPSICSQDGSEGTLIAHENCCQYYKCVHGVPIAQTCPGGLLYNPYKEHCDWAENVECGGRITPEENSNENGGSDNGGSENGSTENGTCNCNPGEAPSLCAENGSDGKLIAHESCNKYYICAHGQPVAQQCQNGLLYNPYEERCNWANDVECEDRIIPEEDCEDNNNESDNTDTVENNGSENESSVEDCYDDPNQATTICGRDGSEGTFVAHANCNQFYVCLGGKPVTLDCPHNLLYNPATKQCDWPENVDCGGRTLPEEDNKSNENTSNEDTSNEDSGNGGSDTCNCNPGEAPTICANKGSNGVLIAHENCNKFYQCDLGLPVVKHCQNGLLYNPYSETCDWPNKVECGDRIIPEEDCEDDNNNSSSENGDNDKDGAENGGSDNGTSVEDCHDNPSQAPEICARDDSEGTIVAHENCNQFYVCLGGQPVILNCPNNLQYNPLIKECDWPKNVDCGDRIIPDATEDCEDSDNSTSEETTTPNNSLEGNSSTEEDLKDSGDGENENLDFVDDSKASQYCQTIGSNPEFLPHQKCNQFYACVGTEFVTLTCTGDLLFNSETKRCEFSEDVECRNRLVPDHGDNEEIEPDTSDNKDEASVEDTKSYESTEQDGAEESDNNDNEKIDTDEQSNENNGIDSEVTQYCALSGSEERVLPHENCNQYYVCIGGVPVVRSCSGQFLFNANIGLCDWPQNVNCNNQGAGGATENGGNGGNSENDANTDVSEDHSSEEEEETNEGHAAVVCSLTGSNNRVVPHDNCRDYYICVNGEPQVRSCSGQFLFNANALQCDWPQNVDCGNRNL